MNNVIKLIKCVFGLISGYLLIPGVYLGFILATNSAKGWNIQNDDGLLFIPIGVLLLILLLLIIIAYITCLFSAIKKKKRVGYIFFGLHLLGIIIYLIDWFFS